MPSAILSSSYDTQALSAALGWMHRDMAVRPGVTVRMRRLLLHAGISVIVGGAAVWAAGHGEIMERSMPARGTPLAAIWASILMIEFARQRLFPAWAMAGPQVAWHVPWSLSTNPSSEPGSDEPGRSSAEFPFDRYAALLPPDDILKPLAATSKLPLDVFKLFILLASFRLANAPKAVEFKLDAIADRFGEAVAVQIVQKLSGFGLVQLPTTPRGL
ncbi:MAG TPA: hypothetical protein VMU17_07190 [Elusimicrobiota bacterium]|nr:hypothetical protein [Elusimicrobiota bacterium]